MMIIEKIKVLFAKVISYFVDRSIEKLPDTLEIPKSFTEFATKYVKLRFRDKLVSMGMTQFHHRVVSALSDEGEHIDRVARRVGKSTLGNTIALHTALRGRTSLILVPKLEIAEMSIRSIMDIYEELPSWIKSEAKIVKFSNSLIEFENGGRIFISTNPLAQRGRTIDFLFIDELLHMSDAVKANIRSSVIPIVKARHGIVLGLST